jgi:hypothetical protein
MAFIITKSIDEHIKESILVINQLASDKILLRYPLYKQLNTARTDQAQVMYGWIDSIRLTANNAQAAINVAPSIGIMRVIVSDYKTLLITL